MISTLYVQRFDDDPEAQSLLKRFRSEGFDDLSHLTIEKVFRLEGVSQEEAQKLIPLFSNSVVECISDKSTLQPEAGPIFEVGYQRAVTDPELPSILRGAEALGITGMTWARIAHRYQFQGLNAKTAQKLVERHLFNPQVQVLMKPDEIWETLRPQGQAGPVEQIDLIGLDDDALLELSETRRLFLNLEQMRALQQISESMGRPLYDAEVEMFAQTWSDHCFHTTWKSLDLLKQLWKATTEINHPLVLSVFEDNAGVMSFYEGWALTTKGETHNSPSAVSPYGGIMTKHGGVIRDTLGCGQGAKPIGGSTVMGLGDPFQTWEEVPHGALHPITILTESIRGTADYCNPMGIPMMFPVYKFHPAYVGKCFALGHSIGFLPESRAPKGKPQPGDYAILIGGPTGMDGLHGATVSSGEMTSETSTVDAAHVQIGHPIEERKFMEAVPVLRDRDCLRAITDLGAAGLSSALGEMGENTGVWVNLAWVPLKTEGMHPWEIWISESQERMMLCVPPEKVDEAFEILARFEVRGAIVGKFTSTKRCQVIFDDSKELNPRALPGAPELSGKIAVNLTFQDLRKGCPLPAMNPVHPGNKQPAFNPPPLEDKNAWRQAVSRVLGHINICDQSAAGHQFDSTVQGITVRGPFGGKHGNMPNDVWASAPLRGKPYGALASLSFSPFYGDVDAAGMAKLMMVESITKLVANGVSHQEIVLCDNFYTPRINDAYAYELKAMIDTCCDLSRTFGTPFISGKDSSNGTFVDTEGKRIDVPPTLSVMAMGRMADVNKIPAKAFQTPGNSLCLAGSLSTALGGSVYLDTLSQRGDTLPNPDQQELMIFWSALNKLIKADSIKAISALGEGGLLRRLFEMALGSGLGCKIDLTTLAKTLKASSPEIGLFAEMIGAVVLETEEVSSIRAETPATQIGEVISEPVLIFVLENDEITFEMKDLIDIWKKPFAEVAL